MDMCKDIHACALAIEKAVLQLRVVRMSPAQPDPFFQEGIRQHLFKARLRGPAYLIRRLAQIAIRN
jgi:sulfur transfer protein SufE